MLLACFARATHTTTLNTLDHHSTLQCHHGCKFKLELWKPQTATWETSRALKVLATELNGKQKESGCKYIWITTSAWKCSEWYMCNTQCMSLSTIHADACDNKVRHACTIACYWHEATQCMWWTRNKITTNQAIILVWTVAMQHTYPESWISAFHLFVWCSCTMSTGIPLAKMGIKSDST